MFTIIDSRNPVEKQISFDQLNALANHELDEIFFSDIFVEHVLEIPDAKIFVLEGRI